MKTFILCQGIVLAVSLAIASTVALAADRGDDSARGRSGQRDCTHCPPPKHYDSREVVKSTKEVDHSRTVETQSVIPSKRVLETNHLIVHENETRNVGTVQHNHTIVEKEIVLTKRNVDHKYVNTVVNLVQHKYHTERRHVIEEREILGLVRRYGSTPRSTRSRD
jgi:hypothetical protein